MGSLNDCKAPVRAQSRILAMLKSQVKHATKSELFGSLVDTFAANDSFHIAARLYAEQRYRCRLGLALYSDTRYLHEIEYILFRGRYRCMANKPIEQHQRGDFRVSMDSTHVPGLTNERLANGLFDEYARTFVYST